MDNILCINKMKSKVLITILLVTICLINSVLGFGVGSSYHSKRPLEMARGETRTIYFELQNMDTDEDVKAVAKLIEGSEIATLPKTSFVVKANTYDTKLPLRISIPKNATGPYHITLRVDTVPVDEGGGVTMGVGVGASFDVLVTEEEVEKEFPYLWVGISLLILIVVIVVYVLSVKKTKQKKEGNVTRVSRATTKRRK